MRICFDTSKKYVIFAHENSVEYKALDKFPAFIRPGTQYMAHAILPVCYNIIARLQTRDKQFRDIKIDADVREWLTKPFKLASLPEQFKFHTKPLPFQEIALRFLYTLGSAGILLDPGMGKSKVALDYIWLAQFEKSLIVCPKPLLFVWEDEIAKHRPELTFYVPQTTNWDLEKDGIKKASVTVLNYNKAVEFKHRLKEVGYKFIYLDEFLIKDIKTQRTKSITELSRYIPFRAGGSGTLINNTPLDAYAPARYLHPSLVGGDYAKFRDTYTVQMPLKDSAGNKTGQNRIVNFRGVDEVKAMLESCCIVMTKEEWLPLPKKTFIDLYCQMSPEQKDAYYGLLRNYHVEIGGEHVEVDNALVMLSKLYQISNGFLYSYKETEKDVLSELFAKESKPTKKKKSDRTTFLFPEQPKIRLLETLLTEKLVGRKSIIWFNMEAEYQLIQELLDKLGRSYLTIRGGETKTGEKVRTFNKDPSITELVCQAKSVNYGITVLGSKREDLEEAGVDVLPDIDTAVYTQVFYSFNFSLEVYLQQQDRIHRLGQEHDCEYYRLFCNSPVDKRLRDALADKMSLREEMLVDVAKTLLTEVTDVVEL